MTPLPSRAPSWRPPPLPPPRRRSIVAARQAEKKFEVFVNAKEAWLDTLIDKDQAEKELSQALTELDRRKRSAAF